MWHQFWLVYRHPITEALLCADRADYDKGVGKGNGGKGMSKGGGKRKVFVGLDLVLQLESTGRVCGLANE